MIVQLRVNACIQEGIRIKDMPEEWFAWVDDIDYGEPMQLNIRLLQVGRLLDLGQMEEAYVALEEIARHFVKAPDCQAKVVLLAVSTFWA